MNEITIETHNGSIFKVMPNHGHFREFILSDLSGNKFIIRQNLDGRWLSEDQNSNFNRLNIEEIGSLITKLG